MRSTRLHYPVTSSSLRLLQPPSQRLTPPATAQAQPRPLQPITAARHLTTTTRLSSPSDNNNNNNGGGPSSWLFSALPSLNLPFPTPGNGAPAPKTLRARRLLPYPPAQLYAIIADIDAYAAFLPHCTLSRVTRWTSTPTPTPESTTPAESIAAATPAAGDHRGTHPDTSGRRHPALADLTVGWGPFTQTYTSRVYCVPGSVVEAVSGRAETSIPASTLRALGYDETPSNVDRGAARYKEAQDKEMEGGIFESLVTRWTVQAASPAVAPGTRMAAGEWTEVTLSVTFQFANPALGFAVGQLADDKVGEMVEAFEGRARQLYGWR
jgi:coenzyme Q-binding protein COQ10